MEQHGAIPFKKLVEGVSALLTHILEVGGPENFAMCNQKKDWWGPIDITRIKILEDAFLRHTTHCTFFCSDFCGQ